MKYIGYWVLGIGYRVSGIGYKILTYGGLIPLGRVRLGNQETGNR